MANFSRIIVSVISFSLIFVIATSSVAVAITDDERVARYRKNYDFHQFSKCLFFGRTEEKVESVLDHIEPSLFVNTCSDNVVESFFSRGLGVSTKGKSVSGLFESLGYQKKQNTANQTIFWEHPLIRGYTPGPNDAKKSAEIQRDVIGKLANAHGLQTQAKTVAGLQVLEIVLIDSPDMERGRMITQFYNDGCESVDKNKELLGDVTQSPPEGSDLSLQLARVGKGKEWEGYRYFIVSQTDGKRLLYRYKIINDYSHGCIDRLEGELSRNATGFVARAALAGAEEKLTPIICAGKSSRDLETCKQSIRNSWQACTKPKAIQGGVRQGELITPSTALIADCLKGKYPSYDEKITESLIAGIIPSAPSADHSASSDEDGGPECALEGGVGWLVCPAMTLIAEMSDGAYGLISMMLDIEPMLLNTDAGKNESVATYTAWGVFRNMANVAFIIIFLIVIFSQVSNVGISNYGIKRIMPRLIIGAILINASFFISQLAVDLSNIAGSSLKELLEVAGGGAIRNTPPPSAAAIAGGILSGTLTVGVVILAGVAIGLPGLLMFLLTILITLLILIGRQAGVVLLVAISPLAFASWILPNTEQWFKKWQKMLLGLLLVYPAVALLFGAGKFAAKVLSADGSADGFMQIAALIVSALPLIATPSLLRGSMNALGTIGAKFSNLGSSTMSSLNKKRMEAFKEKRANYIAKKRNSFMKRDFSGQGKPGGIIRRTRRAFARGGQKILRHSDQVKRDRKLQTDLLQSDRDQLYKQGLMADYTAGTLGKRLGSAVDTAAGKGMMEKLRSEAIGNVEATLKASSINDLKDALQQALKSNDSTTAIAVQNQLLKRGSAGITAFEGAMSGYEKGSSPMSSEIRQDLATNIRESHAGTMDKSLALGQWAIGSESIDDSRTTALNNLAANGMTIEKFSALTEQSQTQLLTSGKAILSQKQLNNLSYPRGALAEKVSPAVSAAAKGAVPKP